MKTTKHAKPKTKPKTPVETARGEDVRAAARDVLAEIYALRDANYFRNHPTNTGALSVACAALEAALQSNQADRTRATRAAPTAHLLELCRAYLAIVDSGDETRQGDERTAAHDAMMDEMQRAGIPFDARWEARWIARYLLAVDAGQLRAGHVAQGEHTKIMWAKIPASADPLQYDPFENGAILLSAAPFRTEADERAHALEWIPVCVTVAPLAMYAGASFERNTDA